MTKAGALRKRYIYFQMTGLELEESEFKKGLYERALKFFGEYGLSFVGLKLMQYDAKTADGIVRCTRDKTEEVLGFLALVNELNGRKARIISKKTSGTLIKLGVKLKPMKR